MKFVKVKKVDGQKFLNFIRKQDDLSKIINEDYYVEHEGDYIFFPLKKESHQLLNSRETQVRFDLLEKNGRLKKRLKKKNLNSFLKDLLPRSILSLVPRAYDIIGDIVVIEFDRLNEINDKNNLSLYKTEIAEAIINLNSSVKTVYEKKSKISGAFRLRDLKLISGVKKTVTLHKENKTLYKLDIKKVFFSPRLVFERKRISNLKFGKNEIIVDLFAGVGPFSIQIAKRHKVKVFAFDINPVATKFMNENIKLNKVGNKINCYNLDVKNLINKEIEIANLLNNTVDRIIMNLPESSFEFIDVACSLLKKGGGILHFYTFRERDESSELLTKKLEQSLRKYNFKLEKIYSQRVVKDFSPKLELKVIDCKIKANR